MEDEQDDFEAAFAHEEPEQEAEEASPEPAVEPTPEEPAAEASVEEEPTAEAEEDPQSPDTSAKEPLSRAEFKGMLEERDKRQKAEAERDALQSQLAAHNATATPAQELQRPDVFDDPEGARAFDNAKYEADRLDDKLNMSEILATQEFGDEKVKEAQLAIQSVSPHERQRILSSTHPYREIIQLNENQGVLSQIAEAGGLEKFKKAWLAEQNGQVDEISETIATAAGKQKPPPSLAKGGHARQATVETTEEEEFADTFAK